MNGRFLRASLRKWRRLDTKESPSESYDQHCCSWDLRPRIQEEEEEEEFIPKDVPRGHLVVYVGESYKRFVIKVTLLKHPLFRALLDQAQDEYGFTPDSKLCIPCDENIFLEVIRSIANTRPHRRICRFCL
ncbi:auxin-responsive protein SAUR50 [Macadamia integrifolia]|uniref:auxin-responsive protein SAUR50 n=1 Tax=Macadamia integrifolia TaxID=60698 RepID=UPI001C4E407D|nr:auxin-responsive protein SAUR50 [Macadamia integrifolia]